MSCGCHKGCGSHGRRSCGCDHSCDCSGRTHHDSCPRPKKCKGTSSETVIIGTCDTRDLVCRHHKKRHKCCKVKEIDVGKITICCDPVRFETKGQVETIVSCCVDGFRQPGDLVPFTVPSLSEVPSMEAMANFFASMPPVCRSCGG